GLVARPKTIAKRLDDVIGRDAHVSRALLDHLQQRLQHADHRTERCVLAFVKATQAVEVPEQLVGAVYDMHDMRPGTFHCALDSTLGVPSLDMPAMAKASLTETSRYRALPSSVTLSKANPK